MKTRQTLRIFAAILMSAYALMAQNVANLRGQVTDPSGAAIPSAVVNLTGPNGATRAAETNAQGVYAVSGLAPGTYAVRITATGFNLYERPELTLEGGRLVTVDVRLTLAVDRQEITVTDSIQVEIDPSRNASATVLQGDDLDALSDDPNDLESDLQALAGPSVGPNGGQIFVDGFSNGQLPPKSSIREIRVNSNPFAAEFDRVGYGRVEILTRPGTDVLRGSAFYEADTGKFDARNPYATQKPDFLTQNINFNLGGSINKKTSFFVDFNRRHQDDQALVRATVLDANFLPVLFTQNVSTPNTRISVSPRVDYQLSTNHTLQARYSWNRVDQPVSGVGGFSLASQATKNISTNHSIQVTETWVMNASTINESRFQYTRSNTDTTGASGNPTINVAGAFTGGAAATGNAFNSLNSYEFQNYSTMTRGTHLIKFGARIRGATQDNSTDQNFNGTYNYASLDAYRLTAAALAQGLPIPPGGGAFQYRVTTGVPLAQVSQVDVAPFIQDDWKILPTLTLSAGLRYETQTNISSYANFAPRVGIAWGIGGSQGRTRQPKTVLRAGWGMFYDRFAVGQVMNTQRFDGVTQRQSIAQLPPFACVLGGVCGGTIALNPNTPLTTFHIDPNLVSPRVLQTGISVERQLPKNITLSVNYTNSRGLHQFRTRNLNTPLPGTFPGAPFYPLGNINPYNQYESSGMFKQHLLMTNVNARFNAKYAMFGFYAFGRASANTDGIGTFPADTYDLTTEWSRAQFDIRHRFLIGGNFTLPLGLRMAPFVNYASPAPFNITLGQDQNGDTQNNDRPTYASPASIAASNAASAVSLKPWVYATPYGMLNSIPVPGEQVIPRNLGNGFGNFNINLRLSRTFGFGEPRNGAPVTGGGGRAGGGGRGFGGPPGGGFGGPGGPGGLFAGGTTGRYQLTISVEARNLLNSVNPSAPVGVLTADQFGQAQGITSGFGGGPGGGGFGGVSQTANRRLQLQLRFNF